jgi:polyribonucleotide nucleotidyltransferase
MPKIELEVRGKPLTLETGTLANQADGAVLVRYGDTVVLATAVMGAKPRDNVSFFPLLVDFEEKMYAAGKLPGGFFKREGRPSESAILSARMVDRPLRPLFPKGMRNDVQIVITVLCADGENPPDVMGILGASAALSISSIPFAGPVGAVRVGRTDGGFIINPTFAEVDQGGFELVLCGTRAGVAQIHLTGTETPENVIADALAFGQVEVLRMIEAQEALVAQVGKPKRAVSALTIGDDLDAATKAFAAEIRTALTQPDKVARELAMTELEQDLEGRLAASFPEREAEIAEAVEYTVEKEMRAMILDGTRPDGRTAEQIRPLSSQVGLLPRTHGSALFTRGQTQVLTIVTLGGVGDQQTIDDLTPVESKRFLHHYNFPPYSVGEVRPLRGPSRRDMGHGSLAERALLPVLPDDTVFPYTIRLVSEVLESSASSSMASVCAASLAMMDAGIPIKEPVAGISMGLVSDENRHLILTDLQYIEDASGDMDFKVAGTRNGVTAIQMDTKVTNLQIETLVDALEGARTARLQVLEHMAQTIAQPREELSSFAPRIFTIVIHPDKIGAVIGPGGKVIKALEADLGVEIDIEQDGRVFIAAPNQEAGEKALKIVSDITKDFTAGEVYVGKVVRIAPFGAFVEIAPGKDGLLHISELARERVAKVEDILNMGDEVVVKIIEVDQDSGKIRLSRKAMLPAVEGESEGESERPRPRRDGPPRPRR